MHLILDSSRERQRGAGPGRRHGNRGRWRNQEGRGPDLVLEAAQIHRGYADAGQFSVDTRRAARGAVPWRSALAG